MDSARIREALLGWYDGHRRDLPWRRTEDPYAIWVSEIMLQQTQVTTVIPYYERFLSRFPDPFTLAEAGEDEVLSAWSGLGYYRRARLLHAGAKEVVRRHAGKVPSDPDTLMELPGIGRYTAGAIASIAFARRTPVLDGNVRRVLARLCTLDGNECGRAEEQRRLWRVAGELVDGRRPGDLNQALMELGATVCTPRIPRCDDCPVFEHCVARAAGRQSSYPASGHATASTRVDVAVAWVRREGKILLERGATGGPLRGKWDLPARELDTGEPAGATLARGLEDRHGLRVAVGAHLASAAHGIMNRRLKLEVYRCSHRAGRVAGREDLRWVTASDLDETPVSGATRKVFRAVLALRRAGAGR